MIPTGFIIPDDCIILIQFYVDVLDNSLVFRVTIPDAVLIQFDLLRMKKIFTFQVRASLLPHSELRGREFFQRRHHAAGRHVNRTGGVRL